MKPNAFFHIFLVSIINYFMPSKKFSRKSMNLRFAVKSFFLANKFLIVFLGIAIFLGFLTGILVAIKSGICIDNVVHYNIKICEHTGQIEFASVWERFRSVLINVLLITVSSLYVLLIPIGFVVVAYRAYLLGFNIAILICLFGVSGAITSILVILPCQLMLLAVLSVYFCMMISIIDSKKRYGRCSQSILKVLILFLIVLLLICIIEAILLGIFSASTILVI